MDYPSRYPRRSNSDTTTTTTTTAIIIGSPEYPAHWPTNNMYNQQQQQTKKHLLGGSFDENKQNHHNFGKIYQTKQSLSVDSMPRRESLWTSITRSATNLLGKHLINGPGTILKTWSSMNTPLSVTVVSPDLYKSLQGNKDHQMVTPAKGFFAAGAWFKDATNNQSADVDPLPADLYTAEILSDCDGGLKKDVDNSDSEKRWNEYKCMYVNSNDLKVKDQESAKDSCGRIEETLSEKHFDLANMRKDLDSSANFGNTLAIDDEPVMLEKPESPLPQTQQQHHHQPEPTSKPSSSMVNALLTTYNKVVNGAADLLQLRSSSPDSALFATKRACSPPLRSTRAKRHHVVSVGRGRGRGRSQLRRSGVSQKRHRKESGRHAVERDLKCDVDAWEELDYCQSTDDEEDAQPAEDVDECDFVKASIPVVAITDPSQRMSTPRKCEWVEFESDDSEEEDSDDEADECEERNNGSFRSRLSSCNSEDSYCIVFDEDASDDTSDAESLESETDSESEGDVGSKKVRFNLVPTVHRMIAWRFAYKAARRNQDLINKEHFRARIARTGRALDPVLKPQLRDRIYHERFEE